MIVLDEAMWAGNHQFASIFKHFVKANERYTVSKHKDGRTIESYFRIGITTNDDWAVPTSGERRAEFQFLLHRIRVGMIIYIT
jgi:hypothetical protein